MKNRYRNPWHDELNVRKPPFYENDAPMVAEYRGVKIFKLFNRGYDFVLAGCCITQRAGITEHRKVIDEILAGKIPQSDKVAEHMRSLGFPAMTYSEYTELWGAGKVA